MEKQNQIVEYLRENYKPDAIVLHGSRATGMQRPHSDWDIILLFNAQPERSSKREEIAGEDVEWKTILLPVTGDNILDVCGVQFQFTKLLWEKDGVGTELLAQANTFFRSEEHTSELQSQR